MWLKELKSFKLIYVTFKPPLKKCLKMFCLVNFTNRSGINKVINAENLLNYSKLINTLGLN